MSEETGEQSQRRIYPELPTDNQFEELEPCSTTDEEEEIEEDMGDGESNHAKYSSRRLRSLFKSVPKWNDMMQGETRDKLKQKVTSAWNNMKYNSLWMNDDTEEYEKLSNIVLLAKFYNMCGGEDMANAAYREFSHDYYSRLWFTYRTSFPPLLGTKETSDCGWGCTLRTSQMLIAQALVNLHLTREWRAKEFDEKDDDFVKLDESLEASSSLSIGREESEQKQREIIALFNDNEESPLGLHSLLAEAKKGTESIGQWFSPSEALHLLRRAVHKSSSPMTAGVEVVISVDMLVDLYEIEEKTANWTRQLLLVVCLRLGLTSVNEFYYKHIKQLLQQKSCLGFVGGQPNRSLYIVGYNQNDVIFLDPHVAHNYVDDFKDVRSFHCKLNSKMPLSCMDPSCAVGFLFSSRDEFFDTFRYLNIHAVVDLEEAEGISRRNEFPLFTVFTRPIDEMPQKNTTKEEEDDAEENGFDLV